jgi:hypothetical protein
MAGPSSSGVLRSANASPVKNRAIDDQSPTASPRKQMPSQRRGSIWDSFFQYDITYQGGNGKAKK